MKKLLTICAVLCLMLGSACVSWGVPMVSSPSGAPSWWNEEGVHYAYGYWSADIIAIGGAVSPTNDASHWGSNYLANTAFRADVGLGINNETISLDLANVYHADLYKQIYVYITGTTTSTMENVSTALDTDSGVFTGTETWSIDQATSTWSYTLEGEIHPQPEYVRLTFTVPGMTSVTNIWAGENCIPEPATMSLLSLGALSLIRRKKLA